MSLILALLGLSLAHAEAPYLVRAGDRVSSIAGDDPVRAEALRARNQLAPGAEPKPGDLLWLPDAPGESQEASLVAASGEVWVSVAAQRLPGDLCTVVPAESTVCTGPDGYATLRLARQVGADDYDDVTLFPSTCLTLRGAHASATARSSWVRVDQGGVAVSRAGSEPGVVTVETPSGLASGSEGGYRVTIEQAAARTEATHGAVAVLGAGQEVALRAGQGARVRTGEAPSDPIDLLGGVAPLTPTDGAPLRVPSFTWAAAPEALGYRIEIAADPAFRELLHQEDLDQTSWEPTLLFLSTQLPAWHWRVAAFDRMGFQGLPGASRTLALPAGISP